MAWSDVILKMLVAIGISQTLMWKAFDSFVGSSPDLAVAKELALAWWKENVDPKIPTDTPETWKALFEDAWAQFASGHPGENPHHGGIA